MVSVRTALLSAVMTAVLPLAGCALRSTPPPQHADISADAPGPERNVQADQLALTDADRARLRAYMRAIEAQASRRHMDVIWINPPDGTAGLDRERLRQIIDGRMPYPSP